MVVTTLKSRLIVIGLVLVAGIGALIPRNVKIRERGPDGVMVDKVERRVPIKFGLDLQGGMHLGLELDQSKRVSADPKKDLDLALTVLRKRIDEFGVTEPTVSRDTCTEAVPAAFSAPTVAEPPSPMWPGP